MKHLKLFENYTTYGKLFVDFSAFDEDDWDEEEFPKGKKVKITIKNKDLLVPDVKVYHHSRGFGVVKHQHSSWDYYVCFNKQVEEINDREKSHATGSHGCKYGHGWWVGYNSLSIII